MWSCTKTLSLQKKYKTEIMTALEINRALQMEVDGLANYEGLAEKVLRYIRRIKTKYEEQFISKDEVLYGIEEGLKSVQAGTGLTMEEFMKEMNEDEVHS